MATLSKSTGGGSVSGSAGLTSSQALFKSFEALADDDYVAAARFLASITAADPGRVATADLGPAPAPAVVNLVYSVVKYMPHLDKMILASDLLVAHTDLVAHLPLVKVLLFQFMACHFEPDAILIPPSSSRSTPRSKSGDRIRWILAALAERKTRLHAAYARVRIELRAHGATDAERLSTLVDWTADQEVEAVPVTFRVRVARRVFDAAAAECLGWAPDTVAWDEMQSDMVHVPAPLVPELLESPLVATRAAVLQDAVSLLPVQLVHDSLLPRVQPRRREDGSVVPPVVLDTRARSETRLLLYHDYGHAAAQFLLAAPASESVVRAAAECGPTIRVLDVPFMHVDPLAASATETDGDDDERVVRPDIIVVEPDNSLAAVRDAKHYMLQERQAVPAADAVDVEALVKGQVAAVQHAMKFPSAKYIVYLTRSDRRDENELVLAACFESKLATRDWRLVSLAELDGEVDEDPTAAAAMDRHDSGMLFGDETAGAAARGDVFLRVPPNPPHLANGVCMVVLARRVREPVPAVHFADSEPESDGEDEPAEPVDASGSGSGSGSNLDLTGGSDPGAAAAGVAAGMRTKKRKRAAEAKRKRRSHRFSLKAWRAAVLGVGVSDLTVFGEPLAVPATSGARQRGATPAPMATTTTAAAGPVPGGASPRKRGVIFPIPAPWK
ncbi:hypothetical protein H9P43_007836 [Blastocladiella emersonii ATCC 22665]|nr:hypothetical protein H9P43_007836 [Blastocladiella emersonii ATCC 22665]